ncbi:MAG: sorbosone dehydrogenase [Acidobacteria bacterium]|nr:MAG: sorbosone dehydrogenase [Acidobacteriota bacterium]
MNRRAAGRGAAIAVAAILASWTSVASLQEANPEAPFFDFRTETPGTIRHITIADLPRPYVPPVQWDYRPSLPSAWPQVPRGFTIEPYVAGTIASPRYLKRAPNGDMFVTDSGSGRVFVIRDVPGEASPRVEAFAGGLLLPFGIAFYPPGDRPEFVYVANTNSVVRFAYASGDLHARGPAETILPQIAPGGSSGHWTRDIAFSDDGRTLFVSIGSEANITDTDVSSAETLRAAILETSPTGGPLSVFASGLRNPVALAVDPDSGDLWTTVNERDLLGNNLPPDYVTRVRRSGFYGWPWFYAGSNEDPTLPGRHPELKYQSIVPDVLLQPHSAPIQLTFYDGAQFPAAYRDDIFVASHGSWNRSIRTGYEVIRIPRANGRATGRYEDFVTGFVSDETPDGSPRGRPAGVAVAADGSLLVSDDLTGTIWRVRAQPASDAARVPR